MCGRFTATFEFSDIRVRWNLDRDLPKYTPRFNIAPEQISPTIPVIVRHRGGNECRLMHWGLIPHWAADPSITRNRTNNTSGTPCEFHTRLGGCKRQPFEDWQKHIELYCFR